MKIRKSQKPLKSQNIISIPVDERMYLRIYSKARNAKKSVAQVGREMWLKVLGCILLLFGSISSPALAIEQCEQACTDKSHSLSRGDFLQCVQLCNINVNLEKLLESKTNMDNLGALAIKQDEELEALILTLSKEQQVLFHEYLKKVRTK